MSGALTRSVDFLFGLFFVLVVVGGVSDVLSFEIGERLVVDTGLFAYLVLAILFVWELFLQAVVAPDEWFEDRDDGDEWFTLAVTGYYRAIYTAVTVGLAGLVAVLFGAAGWLSVGLAVAVCVPPAETALSRRLGTTPLGLVAFLVLLCYVPALWLLAVVQAVAVHTSNWLVEAWRAVSDSVAAAAASPNPSDGSVLGLAGSWVRRRSRLR